MEEIWHPIFWWIHDSIVSIGNCNKTIIVSSTMRCTRFETRHAVQWVNWIWKSSKHLCLYHLKAERTILLELWHGTAWYISWHRNGSFRQGFSAGTAALWCQKCRPPVQCMRRTPLNSTQTGLRGYVPAGPGKRRNCDMATWLGLAVYNLVSRIDLWRMTGWLIAALCRWVYTHIHTCLKVYRQMTKRKLFPGIVACWFCAFLQLLTLGFVIPASDHAPWVETMMLQPWMLAGVSGAWKPNPHGIAVGPLRFMLSTGQNNGSNLTRKMEASVVNISRY